MREEYLGDGLYCQFDGYGYILRAPRDGGDHFVALEPEVLAAFLMIVRERHSHILKRAIKELTTEVDQ